METKIRFFQDTNQSFFLFGPRGTGKSTWIKQHLGDALLIDLLAPEVYRIYSAKPERLREVSEAQESVGTIVIDEVQKVPQLLDVVHQLMENNDGWRFVLTGSSVRKLKRSGVDLLAGRALNKAMHPFIAAELGDRFSLKEALTIGMIPLVLYAVSHKEAIGAYAQNPRLIFTNLCVLLFQSKKTIQRSKIDVTFKPLLIISLFLSLLSFLTHPYSIPVHMDPLNKPGAYKTCFPAIYSKQWKTPISLGEYQQRAGKSVV